MAHHSGLLDDAAGHGQLRIDALIVRPDGLAIEGAAITGSDGPWTLTGHAVLAGEGDYVALVEARRSNVDAAHAWRNVLCLGEFDADGGTLPVTGFITAGPVENLFEGGLAPLLPGARQAGR